MHRDTYLVLLSIVCVALGCGRGDQLPTYEARGRVTFTDGEPIPGGTIIFESVEHPVTARSVIAQDGTFELGTYKGGDGAAAGKYRVAIRPSSQTSYDRDERRAPMIIPPKYQSFDRSGLEYTVQSDEPNEFEIKLEHPNR